MQRHDVFTFEFIDNLVAMLNPRGSLDPNNYDPYPTSVLTDREIMTSKWVVLAASQRHWGVKRFIIARRLSSPEVVFFYTNDEIPPFARTRLLTDALSLVSDRDERLSQSISETDEPLPKGWQDDMFQAMYAHQAMGLAANQIGFPHRVFVMDESDMPRTFINPKIECGNQFDTAMEGCVTFPNKFVGVERATRVTVNGVQLDGLWARIAQHEIDHLNGVTLLDYE